MGNFTKKLKKGLKKAAPLIMAGLAAKAMMGRRKPKYGQAAGFLKSEAAGGASLAGHVGNQQALAKRLLTSDNAYTDRYTGEPILHGGKGTQLAPEGRSLRSYFGLKKGGRVTGIAKRGFGRALKKK